MSIIFCLQSELAELQKMKNDLLIDLSGSLEVKGFENAGENGIKLGFRFSSGKMEHTFVNTALVKVMVLGIVPQCSNTSHRVWVHIQLGLCEIRG